ncbi:MAG: hypothetical protein ACRDPK_10535, partial [Carbonactinosporaceae bacterium]
MPCYRCGARETDPVRGPSPWKRGVTRGAQVLVCPDCQHDDWTAGLDRCSWCSSTMLGRALGETVCRACGAVGSGEVADPALASPGSPAAPGLAEDVEAALDRL